MLNIIEESVDNNILDIKVSVDLRAIASRPVKNYRSPQITKFLEQKYDIIECLSDDLISNSRNGNHKQIGYWRFKLSKTPAPAPKPTAPTKKVSTKTSIRGRMSKIAKEKTNK